MLSNFAPFVHPDDFRSFDLSKLCSSMCNLLVTLLLLPLLPLNRMFE